MLSTCLALFTDSLRKKSKCNIPQTRWHQHHSSSTWLSCGEEEWQAGRLDWREWALACFHLGDPLPSRQREKQTRASRRHQSAWTNVLLFGVWTLSLNPCTGEKTPCVSGYVVQSDREAVACGWLDRAYLDAINHHFACVPSRGECEHCYNIRTISPSGVFLYLAYWINYSFFISSPFAVCFIIFQNNCYLHIPMPI